MVTRSPDDIFASILVDMARSVEIAPRMLPEEFGPGGRYRLEELIGIGRDSHVYLAVDHHLSTPSRPAHVAIKIRASGASTRAEALVGRSVVHDNVVRVIDHGVLEDGTSYVVQEWVDGGDLTEIPLPMRPAEAVRLVLAIARGVQALHSAGNIHGDLKPSNVLRTRDGTPKITDFDLASAADLGEHSAGGNLALMAPERLAVEPSPPTPLSDIYALGGMLYYFLTGTPPHGERAEEILARHRAGEGVSTGGLEPDLARICGRALARDPAERHRSAEALAADLELWLARRPIPWTRPSPLRRARLLVRRRPIPLVIGGLAVAAAIATAGLVQLSIRQELESKRRANELAEAKVEAQRKANEQAQADLEATKAEMRGAIEDFVSSGVLMRGARNGSSVFAALVWVDWFARPSILGEMGPVLARDARLKALSDLREHYRDTGQIGSLPDGLAAFSLAFTHLEAGEPERAAPLIADAEASVLGGLPEGDDVRRSLAALGEIVEFLRARESGDTVGAERLRAVLTERRTQFLTIDGTHDVAHIIDWVLVHDVAP